MIIIAIIIHAGRSMADTMLHCTIDSWNNIESVVCLQPIRDNDLYNRTHWMQQLTSY